MKKTLIEIAVGFGAGLAVAIGGAIKDAPYEGFDILKFMRSPVIGAIEAPILGKRSSIRIPSLSVWEP